MSFVNAIPLIDQYTIAPSLQQGFIDKDSGELLAFGYIDFFRDLDHSTRKPIYTISGPPDAPVFTELPNPLFLSAIGTFIDPNNQQDIIPYYKPFDDEGNIDLYYIEVYNSGNVLQFTRDHYPTVANGGSDLIVSQNNYIPDGQFLLHQDIPANGLVTEANTPLAYGGWIFVQDVGTSATNFVTFPRYDSPISNPLANPRYACEIKCTVPDPADSRKDLTLVITDVNFLQGVDGTFQITAYSNDGVNHNIQLIIRKDYGTGGSPSTEDIIATFLVTPQIQNFIVSFTMSSNTGKTLGLEDDDNLLIVLRSPLATVSDIIYTDAIYVAGVFSSLAYPDTTPEQTKEFAIPASFDTPAYDQSDDQKFVQLARTQENVQRWAFVYNNPIPSGTIIMSAMPGATPPSGGYLYMDGTEYASTTSTSIPVYNELFKAIGVTWGTGLNGVQYGVLSSNVLPVNWNRYDIAQPAPDAGNSGFTFTLTRAEIINTQSQIYTITTTAGSAITGGHYYRLLFNTSGPQFVQLFWLTVDGIGTIPSVTYDVATVINVLSSDTSAQVAQKIIDAGYGLFQIPDARAFFPRFWDQNAGRDPDQSTRYASGKLPSISMNGTGNSGNNVGSLQLQSLLDHSHAPDSGLGGGAAYIYTVPLSIQNIQIVSAGVGTIPITSTFNTGGVNGDSGEQANVPININFNGFIKT